MNREEILHIRKNHLGKSLSTSYQDPLHIVRGSGQYLYSKEGQQYLDCVNNVCHVGHCHPHVVRAGQQQMEILNTNTRYLHDNLALYARRLTSLLPDALRVCFFVNSGSEANELALRLANIYTGQQDLLVMDAAYHGNTGGLVEISPYKYEGKGGFQPRPHVHKVMLPDGYRGPYKYDDKEAGIKYAESVAETIASLKKQGRGPSAFIAESLASCGGQVELSKGYLETVYAHVRAAGGVCIADEVQVGFGRVGSHFWGFETHNVQPDIVTMGKPIGNGHPMAAVVTTTKIANAFANGMEYFNTFGGNPVSCAIGIAVLDVIANEGLQQHAWHLGRHFKSRLNELKAKHKLIGDVRGRGLFLGIEFVRDHTTLEPADTEATAIVERMKKDHGVLLSTDGPLHNVIKIKPPMQFEQKNADFVVDKLDQVLQAL